MNVWVRSSANKPAVAPTAGPGGGSALTFDRTLSQSLDGGARTFNIASNGGFTLVAVVKFTGATTNAFAERLIDFGNGQGSDNMIIGRSTGSDEFRIVFMESNDCTFVPTLAFTSEVWLNVVVMYTASTQVLTVTVGTNTESKNCPSPLQDRTLANTFVGKSNWPANPYANMHLAGLYAVDAVLTPAQIAALVASMHAGEDPQRDVCRACPAGQDPEADGACGLPVTPAPTAGCAAGYAPDAYGACAGCPAGTFKAAAGDAACANCTAGTASNATAATAACPACPPGQIQALGGQTACVDCPADTFRDAYAPATQLADCEACPDFSTSSAGSALETDCQCDAGYVDAAS